MPMSRTLTLLTAMTVCGGGLTDCSTSEQAQQPSQPTTDNHTQDINDPAYNGVMDPSNPSTSMRDMIEDVRKGQGEPIEREVYEKVDPTTGQKEEYIKIDVPESDPNTYANDQDSVKAVANRQIFQQLDGHKTEEVSDTTQHHYAHGSSGRIVRYYPNYDAPIYNSGYQSGDFGYHGYWTEASEPEHGIMKRNQMHNYFERVFARATNVKNTMGKIPSYVTKVTAESFRSIAKTMTFREAATHFSSRSNIGMHEGRIGVRMGGRTGMRAGFGRAGVSGRS